MVYILISIILFILTVIIHIFTHRILVKVGVVTFKTVGVFLIGFLINFITIIFYYNKNKSNMRGELWLMPIPFTAVVLYGLLLLVYFALFTGPCWGEESPSSKIFLMVKKKKGMNIAEIKNNFRNEDLVMRRIDDLIGVNWLEKQKGKYKVTSRGKLILKFIIFYRKILGWELIG